MGENHLTYFKIENFKRFDSFEMENIGQYNLLVGDNNVGKTSVLEGLLFQEEGLKYLLYTLGTLISRKLVQRDKEGTINMDFNENLWGFFARNINLSINVTAHLVHRNVNLSLELIKVDSFNEDDKKSLQKKQLNFDNMLILKEGIRFSISNRHDNLIPLNEALFNEFNKSYYCPYIWSNISYDFDMLGFYYEQINSNKNVRKEFESNLRTFIPKLEEIRTQKFLQQTEMLGVVLQDENGIYPITRFGDGTVKLTRILLEILMAKGHRLMIDEIETGIHFSRLKDFWKTVITLCKKYDVQLFATTHSLECQKYFVYALAELEEEDRKNARNISLLENKEGNIESVTFDYEQFEFALEIGANTRGGER